MASGNRIASQIPLFGTFETRPQKVICKNRRSSTTCRTLCCRGSHPPHSLEVETAGIPKHFSRARRRQHPLSGCLHNFFVHATSPRRRNSNSRGDLPAKWRKHGRSCLWIELQQLVGKEILTYRFASFEASYNAGDVINGRRKSMVSLTRGRPRCKMSSVRLS